MSRRRSATKRVVLPDPKYKDFLVSKFVNNLMHDGKKSVAEKVLYQALDLISH
ncbi:MAG: 30S ribosomal protein S7, partial [Firmicutes bacterium]|nr:30S ribosomal protein S7 [Bacillota bacterium]